MPWRLIQFIAVFAVFLLFIVFNLDNRSDISLGFREFSDVPVFLTAFFAFISGLALAVPFAAVSWLKARRGRGQGGAKGARSCGGSQGQGQGAKEPAGQAPPAKGSAASGAAARSAARGSGPQGAAAYGAGAHGAGGARADGARQPGKAAPGKPGGWQGEQRPAEMKDYGID